MGVFADVVVMAYIVDIPSRSGRMIGHIRTEIRSGLISLRLQCGRFDNGL